MTAGVIVGLLALAGVAFALWPWLSRSSVSMAPPSDEVAEGLRRELDARYRVLDELDEDFATRKLSREDHAQLRGQTERAAAALLARMDTVEGRSTSPRLPRQGMRPSSVALPAPARFARRPFVLGAVAGAILLLGAGLGFLLAQGSAPGSKLTLLGRQGAVQGDARPDPTDVKALLAFGHQALDEGRAREAVWAYRQVLTLEPSNVEAITHTGILLLQSGEADQALAHLDRALALEPKYTHALWDKAQILYHAKQDYDQAIKALEAFLAIVPTGEDADRARAMIAEAKARALRAGSTGGAGARRSP